MKKSKTSTFFIQKRELSIENEVLSNRSFKTLCALSVLGGKIS